MKNWHGDITEWTIMVADVQSVTVDRCKWRQIVAESSNDAPTTPQSYIMVYGTEKEDIITFVHFSCVTEIQYNVGKEPRIFINRQSKRDDNSKERQHKASCRQIQHDR